MPSTLDVLELAQEETDVPCCPIESAVAPAPEPALPDLEPELQTPHELDLHDLELLCGADR